MPTRPVKKPGTKRKSPPRISDHLITQWIQTHEDTQLSRYGVYAYIRIATDEVVYIGKDSAIHENNRKSYHENPANKNQQLINQVLQDHIDEYKYMVIAISADKDWMEDTESALIGAFKAHSECEYNIENDLPREVIDEA